MVGMISSPPLIRKTSGTRNRTEERTEIAGVVVPERGSSRRVTSDAASAERRTVR